jgi:hypothetical protein
MMADEAYAAARCMATCELARLNPTAEMIRPLIDFVSAPIEGYEQIPGAGGRSTGDAAFSISYLPPDVQRQGVPAMCDCLDRARGFDTMPLVGALLAAAFRARKEPLTELTDLQREVLLRMVSTEELWSIGNLMGVFSQYGLPNRREACAKLVGA